MSWRDGLGDTWLMRESDHMEVSPMVEEKSFSTKFYNCLRTSNIWEGRTVIFPISHELFGILNFVFASLFDE